MKKLRMFCLITALILVVGSLTGCGSSNSETGGKTSMFGKYEFFTDKDMEIFRKDEVSINLNGNTYTLGMTKDEIEDMLGEEGKGYRHESRTDSNSFSSVGSYVIEPDGYEYYYSVNNYYYYPNNKLAIIYRSVQDGKETNNPAVSISVNNSSLVDSEGFSPEIDMMDDVKEFAKDNFGDMVKEDINGSEVAFYYNEFGEQVKGRGWVTGDNRPGAWKVYYSYDGEEIDCIIVGCRKAFSGDGNLRDFWE